MKITIYSGPAPRPRPKAGDRRTTKKHGTQVRVWCMAKNQRGEPIGHMVSHGRPMFEWRKPEQIDPWDRHLLTAEEIQKLGAS